ncbi:hypothetical protein HUJ05_003554 [Dendroctonus ponderosae]|nr:hypothetical protein HUJ05_003554 [Dendroctonus ponderosae]
MPLAAAAQKRPLVTSKVNNDGCSKPKVSKKIAPWDYKSKFNDLNDKYQVLQNSSKELASKSEGMTMERKIPILSAERPLQSRLPIHKTQLPNIEEGASVLCGRRGHKAFVPTRLTRRSKSVSDLRGALVTDKPKTNIASSSRMPLAATAQKRPLVTTKVNNDGCSKPKVSKKIAPWDYKSKFNDLNDKYQVLQNSSKELASKSEDKQCMCPFLSSHILR